MHSHYAPCAPQIAKELIAKHQKAQEDRHKK